MKAGVWPCGCALLITHYDKLFKVDPSGSVELLDDSNNGYIGKILNKRYVLSYTRIRIGCGNLFYLCHAFILKHVLKTTF